MLGQREEGEEGELREDLDQDEDAPDKVVQVGWTFDEAQTELELSAGRLRRESAELHWSKIESAAYNISMKLGTQVEDAQASSPNRSRSASPRGGGGLRPATTGGRAAALQGGAMSSKVYAALNAVDMVEKIHHNREKLEGFHARRGELAQEDITHRHRLAAQIEEGFARGVLRHKEVLEDQKKRVFLQQQKRGEQQKAIREFQRDAERQLEAYYSKGKTSPAPSARPMSEETAELKAKAKGVMSEDIFRTTLQSHNEHSSTMQKWGQYVAENERRAEAYWNKMTEGKVQREGVRRTSVRRQTLSKPHSTPQPTKSSSQPALRTDSKELPADASLAPVAAKGVRALDPALTAAATVRGATVKASNDPATWPLRREVCVMLAQERAKTVQQFGKRHEEHLKEARERINRENRMCAKRAHDYNEAWQERNDLCSTRRSQQEVATDEAFQEKEMEARQRRADEAARRQEDIAEMVAEKDAVIRETQENKANVHWEFREKARERLAQYDVWLTDLREQQNKERQRKIDNSKYEELASAAAERRAQATRAYFKSVRHDINTKEQRTDKAKQMRAQPVIKQQRTQMKTKSALGSTQPTLGSPTWGMDFSLDFGGTGSLSLPTLHGSPDASSSFGDHTLKDLQDMGTLELLALRSPTSGRPTSGDSGDIDHEQQFHEEIFSRSTKWLSEIRAQYA